MNIGELVKISDEARQYVRSKIHWTSTWIPRDPTEEQKFKEYYAEVEKQRTLSKMSVVNVEDARKLREARRQKLQKPAEDITNERMTQKLLARLGVGTSETSGFGNCGEMAQAAFDHVKDTYRKELDFAVLQGIAPKFERTTRRNYETWSINEKKFLDYIDIDTNCIACTHCFLVLGKSWRGGYGTTEHITYPNIPWDWSFSQEVVICDPWMRAATDIPGSGTGVTVRFDDDLGFRTYFDDLIEWTVKRGRPIGDKQTLELIDYMKNTRVKIQFNVIANNWHSTKK